MSRLSDTQLIILSNAVRREDGIIELPDHLRRGAAAKVIKRLLANSLIEEVAAKADMPVWRRDENEGCSYALVVTDAGRLAINAVPAGEGHGGNRAQRRDTEEEARPKTASSNRKDQSPAARTRNRHQRQGDPKRKNVSRRKARSGSKQDKVIAMLQAPAGATIAAIMLTAGPSPTERRFSCRG
jgi:hypothetical protein